MVVLVADNDGGTQIIIYKRARTDRNYTIETSFTIKPHMVYDE